MTSSGLFLVVDPPAAGAPRGASLLRSANLVVENDLHWLQGLRWRPLICGSTAMGEAILVNGSTGFKDFDTLAPLPNVDYVPPSVTAGVPCSAISGEAELQFAKVRALALLDRCEGQGIARELWRGDLAQGETPALPNDYLNNVATVTQLASGAAVSAMDALADLENYLAGSSCGGAGMIHATPQTVTIWKHLQMVDRTPSGQIITVLGTTVVADQGYDGSAPGGAVDATGATAWAYATGMIDVRRGPVKVLPPEDTLVSGINRTNNDFNVYAYRPFAATFDPCSHGGVKVDHTVLT